jgi:hypothetical protein
MRLSLLCRQDPYDTGHEGDRLQCDLDGAEAVEEAYRRQMPIMRSR